MAAPVVHFEIIGKDAAGLRDFYSKMFDWKIDANNDMNYGIIEKEGNGIGGGIGSAREGEPPYVAVYVSVPDTDATLKKAESLGGKVIVPTTVIPGMVTFAIFEDPEGNKFGLVKDEDM